MKPFRPLLALGGAFAVLCTRGPAAAQDKHDKQDKHEAHAWPSVRAKLGEGIGVESADGSFGLGLRARIQTRATFVETDNDTDATADMQIRRLRVSLEGHAFKRLVTYKIQLAGASLDLDPVAPLIVRDAYANFALSRDLEVRAGQMKIPYGRQRVVSSGNLQMVDRSIVTSELNLDRDVGVQLLSNDLGGWGQRIGYALGVFGGDGRGRVSGGYGLLYAARIEGRLLGGAQAVELDEPDFARSPRPRLAIAASAALNHKTDRRRSTIDSVFTTGPWASYAHVGADWTFKWHGLSMTGECFWRRALEERNTAIVQGKSVTDVARQGFGGFYQAGYFLTEHFEPSFRIGAIHPLGPRGSGSTPERELGVALSYYFARHALKLQADYFRIVGDGDLSRHQVRLQLQFAP
jgi:hypothetical protein